MGEDQSDLKDSAGKWLETKPIKCAAAWPACVHRPAANLVGLSPVFHNQKTGPTFLDVP